MCPRQLAQDKRLAGVIPITQDGDVSCLQLRELDRAVRVNASRGWRLVVGHWQLGLNYRSDGTSME